MKDIAGKAKILMAVLTISVVIAGCSLNIGGFGPKASYTKTLKVMAAMDRNSMLEGHTSFGDIKVSGIDTSECNIIATVRGQAPTEEEAIRLVNQVTVTMETIDGVTRIKADKPWLNYNRSIGIAYEITLPHGNSLDLAASYGSISIEDIDGNISANSSFGSVECKNIAGNMKLNTSYGKVTCEEILSEYVTAHSSFGNVNVKYAEKASADINTQLSASHGSIELALPNKFAGKVYLSTSFGSIKTDIPIEVIGKFRKDKLSGTIGDGKGSIVAESSFGAVNIK